MHTYSARPQYPSTVLVSHGSSTRNEASFPTARSHERASYRPDDDRPARPARAARTNVRERTPNRRNDNDHDKPASHASAKPSHTGGSAEKPRTGTKNEEHVALMPAKPEQTKQEQRTRLLSIRERLEKHVKKTDDEVAEKERERRRRMNGAIGAATDKHD